MPGQAMRVVQLMGIKACALKKTWELERSRVTGKATSLIEGSPAERDWHFATTQGMLAALRASGL